MKLIDKQEILKIDCIGKCIDVDFLKKYSADIPIVDIINDYNDEITHSKIISNIIASEAEAKKNIFEVWA